MDVARQPVGYEVERAARVPDRGQEGVEGFDQRYLAGDGGHEAIVEQRREGFWLDPHVLEQMLVPAPPTAGVGVKQAVDDDAIDVEQDRAVHGRRLSPLGGASPSPFRTMAGISRS